MGEQVAQMNDMQGSIYGVLNANADSDVRIGDNKMYGDPSLRGAVSEVWILNRVITEAELKAEVEAKAAVIAEAELVAAADSIDLGDLSDVTEDLELPTTADNGVTITWSSDNEAYVPADGKVTVPTAEQGDQTVTLTAVFSSDKTDKTVERTYTVTLLALTDERVLAKGADYVERYVDYIINNGYELLTGAAVDAYLGDDYGFEVEWILTEGDAAIVDGKIVKTETSAERQPIKLKAVVSKGELSQEVTLEHVTLLDEYVAYILSFFGGEDGLQKLHLGYSYDGFNWEKLNDGYTVLDTTLGNGTVRDPFIMRKMVALLQSQHRDGITQQSICGIVKTL